MKAYVDLVLSDPNSQVNDPAVPDFIEREAWCKMCKDPTKKTEDCETLCSLFAITLEYASIVKVWSEYLSRVTARGVNVERESCMRLFCVA